MDDVKQFVLLENPNDAKKFDALDEVVNDAKFLVLQNPNDAKFCVFESKRCKILFALESRRCKNLLFFGIRMMQNFDTSESKRCRDFVALPRMQNSRPLYPIKGVKNSCFTIPINKMN